MKKLNKLQINSDKIMENEELIALRGGYDGGCAGVYCHSNSDCCPSNPICYLAGGFPDHKICVSP